LHPQTAVAHLGHFLAAARWRVRAPNLMRRPVPRHRLHSPYRRPVEPGLWPLPLHQRQRPTGHSHSHSRTSQAAASTARTPASTSGLTCWPVAVAASTAPERPQAPDTARSPPSPRPATGQVRAVGQVAAGRFRAGQGGSRCRYLVAVRSPPGRPLGVGAAAALEGPAGGLDVHARDARHCALNERRFPSGSVSTPAAGAPSRVGHPGEEPFLVVEITGHPASYSTRARCDLRG
jgi:hypothetical protein